jgi:hypothetical protein
MQQRVGHRSFVLWSLAASLLATLVVLPATHAGAVPSTSLVINEIDYDQPSTDTAEYLEIKNVSGAPIDLDPYAIDFVNGNAGGAVLYNSSPVDLPAVVLPAGDYYVVCANAATVPNCDLDLAPDTNFIQNGDPDAVALKLGGAIVDTVSYGGTTGGAYTEGTGAPKDLPGVAGDPARSIGRCADGADTDNNSVDFVYALSTPGTANDCPLPPDPEACGDPATEISAVQGPGASTPINGDVVSVEGVVVGDFQAAGQFGGFYLQDPTPDADPFTSDGIFVLSGNEVAVGDVVRVRGTAGESFGLTQLAGVALQIVCGTAPLPAPAEIEFPVPAADFLERYEGMLVAIPQTMTVTETFDLARFGELLLSSDGRLFDPNNGTGGSSVDNELRSLLLDDGSSVQNPPTVPYLVPPTLRVGTSVSDLSGVLSFGFGSYRLQPTASPTFDGETSPRPVEPEKVGGDVTVASFNVLNYFTTLGSRGASNAAELERQRDKLVPAILGLDADVVGLVEIENNGSTAIDDLVALLNAEAGPGTYAAIADPATGTGTDAIKVAQIYQPASVTPVGASQSSADAIFERRPVAQTYERAGEQFTVVVNHFKSKSGCPVAPDDPEADYGQGCFNARRVQQAQALSTFVDTLAATDPDVLIIGDLNAYGAEDPVTTLESDGLIDHIERKVPADDRYSYVFEGESGYLDHALSTPSLSGRVIDTAIWHINADEGRFLDYNTEFNPPSLYAPDPYRSSDHDPVLVGLQLAPGPYLTIGDVTVTESTTTKKKVKASLPVVLSEPAATDVVVSYSTQDDTAVAPGDYKAVAKNLVIKAGRLSGTINVSVEADAIPESIERLTVAISTATPGVNVADPEGIVTIRDGAEPGLRIGDVTITESGQPGRFVTAKLTVSLDQASSSVVIVDYATADGSAIQPGDYKAKAKTLTFAPGQVSKTISVSIAADLLTEPDEVLSVVLSNAVGVAISDPTGTITIRDDD